MSEIYCGQATKYLVNLTDDERAQLEAMLNKGTGPARPLTRARILLATDRNDPDEAIAYALHVHRTTVAAVRKRCVEAGLAVALYDRVRPGAARKLDGTQEAFLIALACSDAPDGRKRWTMQLLAEKLVALGIVEEISDECVRETLKNDTKPWQRKEWCFPTIGAEFVYRMEDVLDLYAEPADPARPRVCLDEVPVQLVSEVRVPAPTAPGVPARYDYEYQREGTCNVFLLVQPEAGFRQVLVTAHRTLIDFAHLLKHLVDDLYPEDEVIRLVTDNLNIHTPACLYEAFPPEEARRMTAKLEWHYTPKHASWLNMAEIEIGIVSLQCLDRRIPDQATLGRELAAWEDARNAAQATIERRFTSAVARIKLSDLYPSIPA